MKKQILKIALGLASYLIMSLGLFLPWKVRCRYAQIIKTSLYGTTNILRRIRLHGKMKQILGTRQYLTESEHSMKENWFTSEKHSQVPQKGKGSVLSEREVCVLYSGGSDSTLVAALSVQLGFRKVHLLTLDWSGHNTSPHKSITNVARLQTHYGNDHFIHRFSDSDQFFRQLYFQNLWHDYMKYGIFTQGACASCKIAMLLEAVRYLP